MAILKAERAALKKLRERLSMTRSHITLTDEQLARLNTGFRNGPFGGVHDHDVIVEATKAWREYAIKLIDVLAAPSDEAVKALNIGYSTRIEALRELSTVNGG